MLHLNINRSTWGQRRREKEDQISHSALMLLTWYDSNPWADVFINNVFSTLPSSDGRKISLKDAFPLGGITLDTEETMCYSNTNYRHLNVR